MTATLTPRMWKSRMRSDSSHVLSPSTRTGGRSPFSTRAMREAGAAPTPATTRSAQSNSIQRVLDMDPSQASYAARDGRFCGSFVCFERRHDRRVVARADVRAHDALLRPRGQPLAREDEV